MNFGDKVIVITGASQGFGKALAKAFKQENAQVVIVSKTKETLEQTARDIDVISFVADARKEEQLQKVRDFVIKKFGRLDIWINSAGVFKVFPANENIDMEKAREMFDINFFWKCFWFSHCVVCYEKKRRSNNKYSFKCGT